MTSARSSAIGLFALAIAAIVACRDERAAVASAPTTSGGVIDSSRPLAESLRRFREGLPVATVLQDASPSRDALVARLIRAVEGSDTADLRAMTMTRPEFAYLYYPTSPHTRHPTQQAADLVWFLRLHDSQKGVSRLLDRFGGRPLPSGGYSCSDPPRVEGDNSVWDDCVIHLRTGRDTTTIRVFGGVLARGGRYKVFSYANDL